jgi:hypothetical protein
VSAYAGKRLRKGEVIAALEKRDVPVSAWTEAEDVLVAPARLLDGGETYTLALLGQGVVATLVVAEEELPVLERVWPTVMHPRGEAVYCLATSDPLSPKLLEMGEAFAFALPPWQTPAIVQRGVGDHHLSAERCVSFVPQEELTGEFWVPPSAGGGALFDPAPVPLLATAEDASQARLSAGFDLEDPALDPIHQEAVVACNEGDIELAGSCAQFDGPELRVTTAEQSAWFLRSKRDGEDPWDLFRTTSGAGPMSFQPFEPDSAYELLVERFDVHGLRRSGGARGQTGAPRARVVINEVLADPAGPEPQGEWIELFNAGSAAALLEGWTLQDGGGLTALPVVEIPPGRYALVVGRDYSAAAGEDVVPLPDALPVIVERVGDRGLANGGERLRLIDAEGQVVSSVPPVAASKAGHSVARLEPWAPDVKESFARHGAPGASPGGPNVF